MEPSRAQEQTGAASFCLFLGYYEGTPNVWRGIAYKRLSLGAQSGEATIEMLMKTNFRLLPLFFTIDWHIS